MAQVLTVNVAHPRINPDNGVAPTGIDKRPIAGPVAVRAPGPAGAGNDSGLAGDVIGNPKLHGGPDQAVYAYAREDLDVWQRRLGREIGNGVFGENLTTAGIDVTGARIGERWSIGSTGLLLEVSAPRTPCRTFAEWLQIDGWIKTFTAAGVPGTYLRVLQPGAVGPGDELEVVGRPDHSVTVGMVFRALTMEPALLPALLDADALPEHIKERARRRKGA